QPVCRPRPQFLALAESCGAVLTGKPDGSEAITIVFTIEAWRKFDGVTAASASVAPPVALPAVVDAEAVALAAEAEGLMKQSAQSSDGFAAAKFALQAIEVVRHLAALATIQASGGASQEPVASFEDWWYGNDG